jgi:hypothetical protein
MNQSFYYLSDEEIPYLLTLEAYLERCNKILSVRCLQSFV